MPYSPGGSPPSTIGAYRLLDLSGLREEALRPARAFPPQLLAEAFTRVCSEITDQIVPRRRVGTTWSAVAKLGSSNAYEVNSLFVWNGLPYGVYESGVGQLWGHRWWLRCLLWRWQRGMSEQLAHRGAQALIGQATVAGKSTQRVPARAVMRRFPKRRAPVLSRSST